MDTSQIIDSFSDSVMSVCLTKTEIIGGSVDGTVRTFDIRMGRCVSCNMMITLHFCVYVCVYYLSLSCDLFFAVCREISDHLGQPVNCISLSNDENCVLANCLDSTLRLLDK